MRWLARLTILFLMFALILGVAHAQEPAPGTPDVGSRNEPPDYGPPPERSTAPDDNAPMGQDPEGQGTMQQPPDQGTNEPLFDERSATDPQTLSEDSVPAGAEIMATLDSALSTKTNQVGDQFTATVNEPVRNSDGVVVIPAGSRIRGEVSSAEEGKTLPELRGKGRLNLQFREIEVRDGPVVPLLATLVSVNSTENAKTSSKTGEEGEVQAGRSGKETARDIGIGAAVGTVAGLIFGSALKGLAIGAIAGGGYVLATKGKDVELPAETGLRLRVDQPIQLAGGVSP